MEVVMIAKRILRITLTVMTAVGIFWTIYFLINHSVPRTDTILEYGIHNQDGGQCMVLPFELSHWWDIIFSGIWAALIVFTLSIKNTKKLGAGNMVFMSTIIGLGFGLLFCCSYTENSDFPYSASNCIALIPVLMTLLVAGMISLVFKQYSIFFCLGTGISISLFFWESSGLILGLFMCLGPCVDVLLSTIIGLLWRGIKKMGVVEWLWPKQKITLNQRA